MMHNITKLNRYARIIGISTRGLQQLTSERYAVNRGQYATISDTDLTKFEAILGANRCISDISEIQPHNSDFYRDFRGEGKLLLKPKTTEEVSAILKYCNERKLAVCPQGGNTSICGGSTPVFDEIILSTQLMNKIEYIDETAGILVCQSGCVLEKLEEEASERGLCMPLDLGAKGSCQIGGNVSTNAGGLRLLRYGNLHGNVLGVEAVKADGTVLDLMSNFKKDNTGYHLKHLFIGSEGTLGVVTKLAIACPPASNAKNVAFVGVENFAAVLRTFSAAKRELGEIISACELMDNEAISLTTGYFDSRCPIGDHPFYLLIETSGSNADHDSEKVSNFLEGALNRGDILDGTMTSDSSKMAEIWRLRELLAVVYLKEKYIFKYDISVPLSKFYDLIPVMRERLGDMAFSVFGFGHMGDSNLHMSIYCDEFSEKAKSLIEPFIYEYTANLDGSISAEHGIGFIKRDHLERYKQREAVELMKQLKVVMDPNGILNPYKVLKY